jgi:hypothetical protein
MKRCALSRPAAVGGALQANDAFPDRAPGGSGCYSSYLFNWFTWRGLIMFNSGDDMMKMYAARPEPLGSGERERSWISAAFQRRHE